MFFVPEWWRPPRRKNMNFQVFDKALLRNLESIKIFILIYKKVKIVVPKLKSILSFFSFSEKNVKLLKAENFFENSLLSVLERNLKPGGLSQVKIKKTSPLLSRIGPWISKSL